MTTISEQERKEALEELRTGWQYGPRRLRRFDQALTSAYHAVAAVCFHWNCGNDTLFPETKMQAALLKAHDIPLIEDERVANNLKIRENLNDYGPEMRRLVDKMIREWADEPLKLGKLNQAHLRETLEYVSIENNRLTPLPILNGSEFSLLHDLCLDLHPVRTGEKVRADKNIRAKVLALNPRTRIPTTLREMLEGSDKTRFRIVRSFEACKAELGQLVEQRQVNLRRDIEEDPYVPMQNNRDTFLAYFGFADNSRKSRGNKPEP